MTWDLPANVVYVRLEDLWSGNAYDDLPLDPDDREGMLARASHNLDKQVAEMREGGWE